MLLKDTPVVTRTVPNISWKRNCGTSRKKKSFLSNDKPTTICMSNAPKVYEKHSPNVSVVYLTSQEKKPLPTHVEVICKVPSTALCENISTVSKERLSDFIRSCTTSEMKAIDKALLHSLGIEAPAVVGGTQEIEVQKAVSEAEVERNLYKALYEQLLDKVMK